MTKKYEPSPPQAQLDLEPFKLTPAPASTLKAECPNIPARLGQDQYRCAWCMIVWDIDEPRPPCQGAYAQQPQGGTP